MIGIGNWKCIINLPIALTFYFNIDDDKGNYKFEILDNTDRFAEVFVEEVKEIGEDTLELTINVPDYKLNEFLYATLIFNEDSFEGFIILPIVGKIKITDGTRLELL